MTNNIDFAVSPDTQAILLLCGYFGVSQGDVPLKTAEYNKVARWLHQSKRRPADLMQPDAKEWLQTFPADGKIDWFRLTQLLGRGVGLGFEREKWSKQGIWVISRADSIYPEHMRKRLGTAAPVLMYGVGNQDLLKQQGIAIVGGRDADAESLAFTRQVATYGVADNFCIISGGAKGVDQEAVSTALELNGNAIVVLAEGVAKIALAKAYRPHLVAKRLVLVSPFVPQARWTAGNAMGRNKLVYALSDMTVVASSGLEGGTWEGANENLKANWVPILVRNEGTVPAGNRALIERGAIPCNLDTLANLSSFLSTAQLDTQTLVATTQVSLPVNVEETTAPITSPTSEPAVTSKAKTTGKTKGTPANSSVGINFNELKPATHNDSVVANEQIDTTEKVKNQAQPSRDDSTEANTDLFQTVWPLLASSFDILVAETDLPDLSRKYGIQNPQLKAWLTRAAKDGLIKKLNKPIRYQKV